MSPESFIHYKTGHAKIDAEHWHTIELMNLTNDAARISDRNKVSLYCGMLYTILECHFEEEEKLMESINFPYFTAHKEAHKVLLRKMKEIADKTNNEVYYLHKDLMNELQRIFVTHIDHMDMQYVPYLKDNK